MVSSTLLGVALLLLAVADVRTQSDDNNSAGCAHSLACQNLNKMCISSMNDQIRAELNASYTYMSMGTHFLHDTMALKGFSKFFFKASSEERDHALKMVEYLTERGGHVEFRAIDAPPMRKWATGLSALETALALEKEVNAALLALHKTCDGDPTMQDFIEGEFLKEQVESIKSLADHVSRLRQLHRGGSVALGEYIYDKDMQ